jgi:predicted cupin superfamily sugar epimerase
MDINQYQIDENVIFQIIETKELDNLVSQELYRSPSLEEEGFIHFSCKNQVKWVLETFYKNREDVCVLGIDSAKLEAELKYEDAAIKDSGDFELPENRSFPHLYGALNTDAIVNIIEVAAFYDYKMESEILRIKEHYKFNRLPVESTFYTETYTSNTDLGNNKLASTAMLGMYTNKPLSMSCFHRLTADELWHHYDGDSLRLVLLYPDGSSEDIVMGPDYTKGQKIQYVVPAGVWQAGSLVKGGKYALFGCTVAPGFRPEDFEASVLDVLKEQYPDRIKDLLYFNINGSHQKMVI